MYGLYRLCFITAKHVAYAYANVYKNKVIPRIEMQAIDRYIAEHPLPEDKSEEREKVVLDIQSMNKSNELKNAQMGLEQFVATCKIERKAMTVAKEKSDAEKLEKVLLYTRSTSMKFDFTDEELFQLNKCVKTFVTLRAALPAVNINILKKRTLTAKYRNRFRQFHLTHAWNDDANELFLHHIGALATYNNNIKLPDISLQISRNFANIAYKLCIR